MSIDPGALLAAWRQATSEYAQAEMMLAEVRASHIHAVQRVHATEAAVRAALKEGREAQLELEAMDGEDCSRAYARMRMSLSALIRAGGGHAYASDLQAVLDGTEEDHLHDETGE